MSLLLSLFLAALSLSAIRAYDFDCKVANVDYSGLALLPDGPFTTDDQCGTATPVLTYVFSLCRPVASTDHTASCIEEGAFMCLTNATDPYAYGIAIADEPFGQFSAPIDNDPKLAIQQSGQTCDESQCNSGGITIYCPSTKGAPPKNYNPWDPSTVVAGSIEKNIYNPNPNCNYFPVAISMPCVCGANCTEAVVTEYIKNLKKN